jgi:hypothetical protein
VRSRSKSERISIKMELCSSAEVGSTKSILCGAREERGMGSLLLRSKSILLFFRARAGSTKCISFFFILIGFKG